MFYTTHLSYYNNDFKVQHRHPKPIICYNLYDAPYVIAFKSLNHSRRAIQDKFDPAITLTAYNARSNCGPRGQHGGAGIRQRYCPHGAVVIKEYTGKIIDKPTSEWNTVAVIDGC